ncbi:eCIS core domain-containing protein [Sorangium sp. So ce388]|uniref:eCIS core domain-containing protein n=1 Tax=Sorangium sp. So ce388 TaxID=3133309 RepID=UPI003F5B341D
MPRFLQASVEDKHASADDDNGAIDPRMPAVARAIAAPGAPLPDAARWSSEIGRDVSGATIAIGPEAREAAAAVGARAFTVGSRIVMGDHAGASSGMPRWLLRHELAHVAQQQGARVPPVAALRIEAADSAVERAARTRTTPPTRVAEATIAREPQDGTRSDSATFYNDHKALIWNDIIEPMCALHFDTGTSYADWLFGRNDAFVSGTLIGISQASFSVLSRVTAPDDADAAIRRGRDADERGYARNEYDAGVSPVPLELRGILERRIQESLRRVAPQYVAAGYLAMRDAVAMGRPIAPVQPVPEARLIVPSHPMDRFVIDGLRGQTGSQLQINYARYVADGQALTAELQLRRVREVTFTWEARRGAWLWIRIASVEAPTREEAANALYGDPALASSIIAAPPLFAFEPALLTPARREEWRTVIADPSTPRTALDSSTRGDDAYRAIIMGGGLPPVMSPMAELLRGPLADEAALAHASALPSTGATRPMIISRLRMSARLMSDISADASALHLGWYRGRLVAARITARADEVVADQTGAVATRWDAHSQAQAEVLRRAANGTRIAVEQYRSMLQPGGDDVPAYLRAPLDRVADAYIEAAGAAELPTTAEELLGRADARAALFPIEMLEGVLTNVRSLLREGRRSGPLTVDVDPLVRRERRLRERLLEARDVLRRDPSRLQPLLASIQVEVSDLQDEGSMAVTLRSLNEEMDFLIHNTSFVGEFTGKNARYTAAWETLLRWASEFYGVYLAYESESPGIRAEGRQRMARLRERGTELSNAISNVASMIDSQETRERWISFGARIAVMIGISVITAGIGSYVSSALLVGAGWGSTAVGIGAATVVTAGVEAAAFTGFSMAIFGRNPHQGVVSQFLENWILFGSLRGLSVGMEVAAAVRGTETGVVSAVLGRGGNIAVGLSLQTGYGLLRADQEQRARTGQGLTDEQKAEMVTENLVVFIGTMLASRYGPGRGFLEGAQLRGEQSFLARFATVDAARAQAFRAASALARTSPLEQVRRALDLDRAALEQERDLLRDLDTWAAAHPGLAAAAHLNVAALRGARTIQEAMVTARERTSLALELMPAGGRNFECAPGRLDEVLRRYEALGDRVSRQEADPDTGQRAAVVTPAEGPGMRIVEALPGSPEAGATWGPNFYRTTVTPHFGVEKIVTKLRGLNRLPDGAQIDASAASVGGTPMVTSRLTVPVTGGSVPVELIVVPREALPASVHGAAGGAGRVVIRAPSGGHGWRATVLVDARIDERDARFVLGHEIVEVIDTVREAEHRAASNPSVDLQAFVAERAQARVMRQGSTATSIADASSHDRGSAWELARVFEEFRPYEQRMRFSQEDPSRTAPPPANEYDWRRARLERMLEAFGMRDRATRALRLQLLREAGMNAADLRLLEIRLEMYEFTQTRGPVAGVAPADMLVTERLLDHVLYAIAPATEAIFKQSGISGGHITRALLDCVARSRRLHLVEEASMAVGSTQFRKYSQYWWKGSGAPHTFPPAGRPQKLSTAAVGVPTYDDALWERADFMKTTCDDVRYYLHSAERAWQALRAARFPTEPGPLQNIGFGPSLPSSRHPAATWNGPDGAIQFGGIFNYEAPSGVVGPNPSAPPGGRFHVTTIFPEGTWVR